MSIMRRTIITAVLSLVGLICLNSCGSNDGLAPSSSLSASVFPVSLIVPKGISANIKVTGIDSLRGTSDVTAQAQCTSNSPFVTISSTGLVSNNYTGSSVVRANVTCSYANQTFVIPVTIVPAVLQSLTLTKNNLVLAPGQTQSISVYGNFIDSLSYVFALDMTNFVTWSSLNSAVSSASVGTVSGNSVGSTAIKATFSTQSASTTVSVASGATASSIPIGVGLTGTYYDFTTGPWTSSTIQNPFEILFGSRIDSQVYFDWSTGTNNLGQLLYFGIRWTGKIYIPTTGSYTFYTQSDDGVRMSLDGVQVINNWTLHASVENASAPMNLTAGQFVDINMEYFENAGYSLVQLRWSGPSIPKALIPQVNLFPQ